MYDELKRQANTSRNNDSLEIVNKCNEELRSRLEGTKHRDLSQKLYFQTRDEIKKRDDQLRTTHAGGEGHVNIPGGFGGGGGGSKDKIPPPDYIPKDDDEPED